MINDTTAMPTPTRQVDSLTLRYADTGAANGPGILLTSPWPESLLAFRRICPILARSSPWPATCSAWMHMLAPPAAGNP